MSMDGWAFAQIQSNVKALIENELKNVSEYQREDMERIGDRLTDSIMKKIQEKNKNFKFIVNCIITEKKAAECGLHSTCYWNSDLDGSITCTWQNERYLVLICLYALAL